MGFLSGCCWRRYTWREVRSEYRRKEPLLFLVLYKGDYVTAKT